MSEEAAWTQDTPGSIAEDYSKSDQPADYTYESVEQVVAVFKERMLTSTIHYETQQYLDRLHPWYLSASFEDLPEAAHPFIVSALTRHFNGRDETGGVIFPVDQIKFAGKWILIFGDINRADEITPWPWHASNYA